MASADLDFTIARLGECRIPSPMQGVRFTGDDERVLYHSRFEELKPWLDRGAAPPAMECAGPRQMLHFDPSGLACGIVTCGGLCPGLNDVIRAIVLSLYHHYGVRTIYGFRFGFEGLVRRYGHVALELTPASVNRINDLGGSILGSSRGPQKPEEMVETLKELKVGILFAIGGDGTLRGAQAISDEAARRGMDLSVIGIPKTRPRRDCRSRRRRPGPDEGHGREGCVRKRQVQRYRHLPARRDQVLLLARRSRDKPEVHRSQLHHQEPASYAARLSLLPAPGS